MQCAITLFRFKLPNKIEFVKITKCVNPHFVIQFFELYFAHFHSVENLEKIKSVKYTHST